MVCIASRWATCCSHPDGISFISLSHTIDSSKNVRICMHGALSLPSLPETTMAWHRGLRQHKSCFMRCSCSFSCRKLFLPSSTGFIQPCCKNDKEGLMEMNTSPYSSPDSDSLLRAYSDSLELFTSVGRSKQVRGLRTREARRGGDIVALVPLSHTLRAEFQLNESYPWYAEMAAKVMRAAGR